MGGTNSLFAVIPAEAGIQRYARQRGNQRLISPRTRLLLDSRLRGNDGIVEPDGLGSSPAMTNDIKQHNDSPFPFTPRSFR